MKRTSIVDSTTLKLLTFGSVYVIGDSEKINTKAQVIAVQRERELFYGEEEEWDFNNYPIYKEVIPVPPNTDCIKLNIYSPQPCIHVGSVNIIGISTACIFQVGSTKDVYLESRIHHTRQFKEQKDPVKSFINIK